MAGIMRNDPTAHLPDDFIPQLIKISERFHTTYDNHLFGNLIVDLDPKKTMREFPLPFERERSIAALLTKLSLLMEDKGITCLGRAMPINPDDLDDPTRPADLAPWRLEIAVPINEMEKVEALAKDYNGHRAAMSESKSMRQ